MAFMMEIDTIKKGDVVTCSEDNHRIVYIVSKIYERENYCDIFGIKASENGDDIIIMSRYVPISSVRTADESMYNQIGYLMKVRDKILKGENIFTYKYSNLK